ncbi:MAG: hypothetical protein C5B49_08455 [Bdellovibrio sp.]|nr:MAG: hypothetical protein C5B49_08455 [Bdellovibrio sp.]
MKPLKLLKPITVITVLTFSVNIWGIQPQAEPSLAYRPRKKPRSASSHSFTTHSAARSATHPAAHSVAHPVRLPNPQVDHGQLIAQKASADLDRLFDAMDAEEAAAMAKAHRNSGKSGKAESRRLITSQAKPLPSKNLRTPASNRQASTR